MTVYGGVYHFDGVSSRGGSAIRDDVGYLCELIDISQGLSQYSDSLKLQRFNSVPNWPQGYYLTWSANGQSGSVTADQFNSLPSLGLLNLASWSRIKGDVSAEFTFRDDTCIQSECSDDSDCPDGEKCLDGDCVPCEKLVDGLGIVTLWGSTSSGEILTDGLSVDISSGIGSVILEQFAASSLRSGRIQIPNGMKGNLTIKAGIGLLGSDFGATVDLFSGSVDGFYQDFIFDSGKLPLTYSFNGRVVFEILNYDTLGDCADDVNDDTPDDPPDDKLPPGDDDLDDIIDDPGDEEDDSGGGGSEPPEPELCECEKYIGKQIARLSNSITSAGNVIKGQIYLSGESIRKEINQQTSISREFVLFSKNQLLSALIMIYFELRSMRVDLSSIRSDLEGIRGEVESLDDNIKKGLILPECGDESEKGFVKVFKEFSDDFMPVSVEVTEADVIVDDGNAEPEMICRKPRY